MYLRLIQFTFTYASTGLIVRPIKYPRYASGQTNKVPFNLTRQFETRQSNITVTWNHKPIEGQTNNIDQIRLPRIIRLIQQQASLQPLGVRLLLGTYVNWRATNIDETICVKSGNQQDQTLAGKVNEYADPDKRCRSKRENCCCHTLTPS